MFLKNYSRIVYLNTYCQIDQMKLPHAHMLVTVYTLLTALDGDGEDSMRSRAVLVHVCSPNRSLT